MKSFLYLMSLFSLVLAKTIIFNNLIKKKYLQVYKNLYAFLFLQNKSLIYCQLTNFVTYTGIFTQ